MLLGDRLRELSAGKSCALEARTSVSAGRLQDTTNERPVLRAEQSETRGGASGCEPHRVAGRDWLRHRRPAGCSQPALGRSGSALQPRGCSGPKLRQLATRTSALLRQEETGDDAGSRACWPSSISCMCSTQSSSATVSVRGSRRGSAAGAPSEGEEAASSISSDTSGQVRAVFSEQPSRSKAQFCFLSRA